MGLQRMPHGKPHEDPMWPANQLDTMDIPNKPRSQIIKLEMVKKLYIYVRILSKCRILGNMTFWLKNCTIQIYIICGAHAFYPNGISTLHVFYPKVNFYQQMFTITFLFLFYF